MGRARARPIRGHREARARWRSAGIDPGLDMGSEPLIRIDLESRLRESRVMLELGCGRAPQPGRIGIDAIDLPGVDIVADLENGLPFIPSTSVDEIHARSLLEHLDNFEPLMREIVRVL